MASPYPAKQIKDHINHLKSENQDLAEEQENCPTKLNLKNRNLFLNSTKEEDENSLLAKLKVYFLVYNSITHPPPFFLHFCFFLHLFLHFCFFFALLLFSSFFEIIFSTFFCIYIFAI